MAAFINSPAKAALILFLIEASLAVQPFRESAAVVSPGAKLVRSERATKERQQQQEPHMTRDPNRKVLGFFLEWANGTRHEYTPSKAMLAQIDSKAANDPDPTVTVLNIPTNELYAEAYCGGKAYVRTCGFKHGPGICLKMATSQGVSQECWRGLCMCNGGRGGCREPVCRGPNDTPPFTCTAEHTPCADGSCITLPGGAGWECWHPCNMNHRPWEYGQENQILVEDIRACGACETYLRSVRAKAHLWFVQSAQKLDPEETLPTDTYPNPKSYPGDGNGETRTEAAESASPQAPTHEGGGSTEAATVVTATTDNQTVVVPAPSPPVEATADGNAVPDDVQASADAAEEATVMYSDTNTQPTIQSAAVVSPTPAVVQDPTQPDSTILTVDQALDGTQVQTPGR